MRAVQLIRPGSALVEREVAVPSVGSDDVLVRVRAAGICRSDAHYRAGFPEVGPLPLTLGHEVAGVVERCGPAVSGLAPGDRVCLHYQVGCGHCEQCSAGFEQFCPEGRMLGNGRDGGYAGFVAIPARNAHALPEDVSFEHAAVMMCSSATSLHALRKGRLAPGERVAVIGAGGLGMSAVQLAFALGAAAVYAVEPNPAKRDLAAALGAVPVDIIDPVAAIRDEGGADVALELVGSGSTMRWALDVLRPMGRAVAVGLTADTVDVGPYRDLVRGEHELIGASDHLGAEIPELLEMAADGRLDLTEVVGETVPLDAGAVNATLDRMLAGSDVVRTVVVP